MENINGMLIAKNTVSIENGKVKELTEDGWLLTDLTRFILIDDYQRPIILTKGTYSVKISIELNK